MSEPHSYPHVGADGLTSEPLGEPPPGGDDICKWCTDCGLDGSIAKALLAHDVRSFDVLATLSEADMMEIGLSLGHRRKLRLATERCWGQALGPAASMASAPLLAQALGGDGELSPTCAPRSIDSPTEHQLYCCLGFARAGTGIARLCLMSSGRALHALCDRGRAVLSPAAAGTLQSQGDSGGGSDALEKSTSREFVMSDYAKEASWQPEEESSRHVSQEPIAMARALWPRSASAAAKPRWLEYFGSDTSAGPHPRMPLKEAIPVKMSL